MFAVIKAEIKKNFKRSTIIITVMALLLSILATGIFSIKDTYADLFYKYSGLAPIMGLAMFMIFSGSFINEYDSNMDGLIKATRNGKNQLVLSKFIASGISASIVNLLILYSMVSKALLNFNFQGLDIKISKLWYFKDTNFDINVLQMILIMTITVIIGSFLLASIGIFLSSLNKGAVLPFLTGAVIMGIPYIRLMRLRGISSATFDTLNLHLFGMYSSILVKYNASINLWILYIVISMVIMFALYNLTKKRFLKEM